jgi:formate hydrogenlyase transcriptional activator
MEIINKDLELLISINDDIATVKDTKELFFRIFVKLRNFYHLKMAGLALFDKNKEKLGSIIVKIDELDVSLSNTMIWISSSSENADTTDLHLDNPRILIFEADRIFPLFKQDAHQKNLQDVFKELSITSLLMAPMQTGGELVGFLMVPMQDTPLDKEDQDYLLKIANLIGSAISNAGAYAELEQREKLSEMQVKFLTDLVAVKDKDNSFAQIISNVDKFIPSNFLALYLEHKESNFIFSLSYIKDENGHFKALPTVRNFALSISSLKSKLPVKDMYSSLEVYDEEFDELCSNSPYFKQLKEKHSIKSIIIMQYTNENGTMSLIAGRNAPFQWLKMDQQIAHKMFSNVNEVYFGRHELEIGRSLLPPIGLILSNIFAFDEIRTLTKKLEQEKNYLLEEINLTNNFQEIIGNSQAIQNTLYKVRQVAPLDATVLIQGETGVGKELIARAVHNLSNRKEKTFITVNCAALPAQLIESELFGHEKGSFTSAVEKRIGKFEVADGGTIFLDEIGELPLEIQAKLLRVLQEKEFERLGGKSTIHLDVRIVAATNRDLEKEVAEGKFRADLFFRLNVFPILVPPLRERSDDIPLLIKYFIEKYSKRIGKNVSSIRKTDMDLLMNYNWPGNVRELEHMTERAIIVSAGDNLNFENLFSTDTKKAEPEIGVFKTLEELEKEHIVNALKATNGKVTGEKSASQLLGINGKTLGSKMRKFRIKREISIATEDK